MRFLVAMLLCGHALLGQTAASKAYEAYAASRTAWNSDHYAKAEVKIPMRDGKELFTVIFTPKDKSKTYPILLCRSPYGQDGYGPAAPFTYMAWFMESCLAEEGFIFVGQDVRGRYLSAAGDFDQMRPIKVCPKGLETDESTDAFDTIEWLLRHVNGSNGKVGVYGESYDGFYAAAALVRQHPAVKAAILSAPIMDWWDGDDSHRNGATRLAQTICLQLEHLRPQAKPTDTDAEIKEPSVDGYRYFLNIGKLSSAARDMDCEPDNFWNVIVRHPNRDEFAKARDIRPHLDGVTAAVMTIGGWFDNENLFGSLNAFASLEKNNHMNANSIVIGPWTHGNWRVQAILNPDKPNGDTLASIRFGTRLSMDFQEKVELPFLLRNLKQVETPSTPRVTVFETGSNTWKHYDAWPPRGIQPTPLFLQSDGHLDFTAKSARNESDQFVSNPNHPVPYTQAIAFDYHRSYMAEDQRFAETRPDVLTYQTEVLQEDLTIAGAVKVDLWTMTTGTDADWVVKLIDVWPSDAKDTLDTLPDTHMAGYEQLIRGDILRGKFRESLEKPMPMTPGCPTEIPFNLLDCCHTFKKGHKIMLQIQSSWFPLFDRNPQVFTNIMEADKELFKVQTHTVMRSSVHASKITLPVLPSAAAVK